MQNTSNLYYAVLLHLMPLFPSLFVLCQNRTTLHNLLHNFIAKMCFNFKGKNE